MAFNPRSEYTIVPKSIAIRDFFEYQKDFVTRPPYQRKAVWSKKKKQSLMDSLFRRYYVPKLVIREVRLSDDTTVNEIVDGQQRITTVQDFFEDKFPLPKTLADIDPKLVGAFFSDLDSDIRKFIDKNLQYEADIIKDIENPQSAKHQKTATEIFWRLQQGESLNYMEVAHAQLSSLTRNFIVKYADGQAFDYKNYKPIHDNPQKLKFFNLLNVDNTRMKHLQYMARFLLIEMNGGYANLSDQQIKEYINDHVKPDGIGDETYEDDAKAKAVLKTLRTFYDIFQSDPMYDESSGIKELSIEYFIISIYMLVRHLSKNYVINDAEKLVIREFVYHFHLRWKTYDESQDMLMLTFSNNRQQGENELQTRDQILRQIFFKHLDENNVEFVSKDSTRGFSELQKIQIYREAKGLCQQCLAEGKPESDSKISWKNYEADHILPHSKGGQTIVENGALLCKSHNRIKSDSFPT